MRHAELGFDVCDGQAAPTTATEPGARCDMQNWDGMSSSGGARQTAPEPDARCDHAKWAHWPCAAAGQTAPELGPRCDSNFWYVGQ